jgi:hypothetical protein
MGVEDIDSGEFERAILNQIAACAHPDQPTHCTRSTWTSRWSSKIK